MEPKSQDIDINHLNHFTIWIIIGTIMPDKYIIASVLGILWELLEISIVNIKPLYYITKKYWPIPEKFWNETIHNKIFDFIVNLFGYFIGSKIRTHIIKC